MTRRRLANAVCAAAAALILTSPGGAGIPPRISIIIDDLGYQLEAGRRAIDLPGPLAYAVLPGTPGARLLARRANANGKEVLLHLPLEAAGYAGPVEPGVITLAMSHADFQAAFEDAIKSVPFAVGVSSHRGSLLTRHPGHMAWLMEEIHRHAGLFFVDSYTTEKSVALQVAAEVGVMAIRRDVFLDHDLDPEALRAEFQRLKKMARMRGKAVAIGHPYPATMELLEREIPRLAEEGFELVPVSQLIT